MRRLIVTNVFGMFLCGCASTVQNDVKPPAVSQAERSAATNRLLDCQLAAARKFDDGKSDAATIGRAVTTVCTLQSEEVFETITRGQSAARIRAVRERWPQTVNDLSATAVLHVRSGKNEPRP